MTSHAVLHDNGGYGMLGMGYSPDDVIDRCSKISYGNDDPYSAKRGLQRDYVGRSATRGETAHSLPYV